MNIRYQNGHIRLRTRKKWSCIVEFMWRAQDSLGKRVRRTTKIGTIDDYPTRQLAEAAVKGLRMRINEERNRKLNHTIRVSDLIDHYVTTELSPNQIGHSYATRIIYREFLIRWIKPRWGSFNLTDIRTIAVETWLTELRRRDGEDLAIPPRPRSVVL
jgi:predicted metal-dependent hydrolase